jgi:preprotein translocase subunit Sec61beta
MAKKAGGRLISSAGLVNYYESTDRRSIQINPYVVAIVAAAIGAVILVLNAVTGLALLFIGTIQHGDLTAQSKLRESARQGVLDSS